MRCSGFSKNCIRRFAQLKLPFVMTIASVSAVRAEGQHGKPEARNRSSRLAKSLVKSRSDSRSLQQSGMTDLKPC
jgi:hypothetical protein